MITLSHLTVQWCLFKVNALMRPNALTPHCDSPCERKLNIFIVWSPHLQQPEGRSCRNESWSQEADAGEVPQHEQVWGHQWAPDEVRVFFFTYIFLNSVFDRQRVKPPVASSFLLLEAQTFRKVKRNRTGTTTSPSCRRFTLGEATWPPNRALSVLRRWERNKLKWSTTTIITEAWSISSITLSDWTTHESTAYKNPRRHGRRKRSLSFHQWVCPLFSLSLSLSSDVRDDKLCMKLLLLIPLLKVNAYWCICQVDSLSYQSGTMESSVEMCLLLVFAVSKTEEEIQEILERKEAQIREKQQRKKKQEKNVAEKKEKLEEHKWVFFLSLSLLVHVPLFFFFLSLFTWVFFLC